VVPQQLIELPLVRMRPQGVALPPPAIKQGQHLSHRGEQLYVQQFSYEPGSSQAVMVGLFYVGVHAQTGRMRTLIKLAQIQGGGRFKPLH